MIHDFQERLQYSHDQSEAPFWKEIYIRAFPGMKEMIDVRKDGWAQRGGIDRVIVTDTGRTWTIDEKVRSKDYGDILLEFISNDSTKSPGWVVKDLACDFIAYAVVPKKQCFLLPVLPLQRAWAQHNAVWLQKYGIKSAQNGFYNTLNCPVPYPELMRKISEAMFFKY